MTVRALALVLAAAALSGCNEQVDAFYYPDRTDLTVFVARYDVGTVEACRDWVHAEAERRGDPGMRRSDYECGIGPRDRNVGFTVYRETRR